MVNIDKRIYSPASVREMDRLAIEEYGIPGYVLMTRAGESAFSDIAARFPGARRWLVLCGAGNNAGDGYVVARCAREAGLDVTVVALVAPEQLAGDAARAWQDYSAAGGAADTLAADTLQQTDLVIDALLGTGIDRTVSGRFAEVIEAVNAAALPVAALDVPSGLNAETGQVMGIAIRADLTLTFVGDKQGFYLAVGPDHVGELRCNDLDIPPEAVAGVPAALLRYAADDLSADLPPRRSTDHKGRFGHVVVIGGNRGMGGAARLAGEAALRTGAGLVSAAVHPDVAVITGAGRPELMVRAAANVADLEPLLNRATVIALGPGLGQDEWARALWQRGLDTGHRKVLDADALNLLAREPHRRDDWVLTPHPGEAAALLGTETPAVQADRLGALRALNERFGGVTVLKGHGTLIGTAGQLPLLVDAGNPGMATAGMGDVLTGVVAGLLAQLAAEPVRTAAAAAFAHGAAGDHAARAGQRGTLAGDLFPALRSILNPDPRD